MNDLELFYCGVGINAIIAIVLQSPKINESKTVFILAHLLGCTRWRRAGFNETSG